VTVARDRCLPSTSRLLSGAIIFCLGVVFLASNLGWIDGREALHYFWPIAFLAVGFVLLVDRFGQPGWLWSWAWIVAGSWLLGYELGWIRYRFWDLFFPLLLLVVGLRVVFGAFRLPRADGERPASADADVVRAFAVLAGNERRTGTGTFRGGDLMAFMGAVKLDLSGSKLAGEEATIDVVAVWGGIEIRVPPEWTVVGKVAPVLGAYEDKTRPPAETGKRLVIRGLVVMGGVEVRN
jgi:predicted membrane protein